MSDATQPPIIEPPLESGNRSRDYLTLSRTGFGHLASAASQENTNEPRAYADFIDRLNQEIARDPQVAGKAFIIMPPTEDSPAAKKEFDRRLRIMAHQTMRQGNPALAMNPSQEELRAEEWKNEPAVNALSRHAGNTLDQAATQGFGVSSLHHEYGLGDRSDPRYISAAVPMRLNENNFQVLADKLAGMDNKGVRPSAEIEKNLPNEFLRQHIALHELGHILHAVNREKGENRNVVVRRSEVTAEAFTALYLIQKNEPDIEIKLQSRLAMREATVVGNQGWDHDTGLALRQVVADLPKLRTELKNQSPDGLLRLADRYARDSLRKDYPHLYDNKDTSSNAELLAKTEAIDKKLSGMVEYSYARWRQGPVLFDMEKGEFRRDPDKDKAGKLDVQEAAFLLRVSGSASLVSGNDRNLLAEEIKYMRAVQPDVFNQAYKSLGLEPPPPERGTQNKSTPKTKIVIGTGYGLDSPFG